MKNFKEKKVYWYNLCMQTYNTAFYNALDLLMEAQQASFEKPFSQRDTTLFHQLVSLCEKYGFPTYFNAGFGLYRKVASSLANFQ